MATKVQSSPRLQQPLPPFSLVERELVCVVLEDCADQLAVLGGIVQILESQRQLEQKFDQLTLDGGVERSPLPNLRDHAHSLTSATHGKR